MIYFFDGTKTGFLTAFLLAYQDGDAVLSAGRAQLALGQETALVNSDAVRAEKAERRFLSFDKRSMRTLDMLLRCGYEGHEQTAFRYFRLLAEKKRPISEMFSESAVMDATELLYKIGHEIDRMYGFLRFMESASGALYAPVSPDSDIVDLLLPHFRARLPAYPFVIHDVKRQKAAIYDGKNSFFAPLAKAELVLSANEEDWQALWKRYYRSVNIPSRERLKQMRGFLPVRYRQFMPEFHGSEPT